LHLSSSLRRKKVKHLLKLDLVAKKTGNTAVFLLSFTVPIEQCKVEWNLPQFIVKKMVSVPQGVVAAL
jgi:hypothetical protein